MCDEAVDDHLAALKFIPDSFVKSNILKKFNDALNAGDDIKKCGFTKIFIKKEYTLF